MRTTLIILTCLVQLGQAQAQDLLAQAKQGKLWGYTDTKGEFVIQPKYDRCSPFTEDGLAAIYEKKRKSFYFIKPDGSELETEVPKFLLANVFGFGTKSFSEGMVAIEVDKKWGYLNTDGKLVVPTKFDKALEFNSGHGVARLGDDFYLIDKSGKEVKIDIDGLQDVRHFSEGLAPYRVNDKWGYIGTDGKVKLEAQYRSVGYMNEGLAWVKNDAGLVGYIDKQGKVVIDLKYEAGKDFSSGVARVKSGDWTYIDASGKTITVPEADTYGNFSEGLAYAKVGDKVGFIDVTGKWVIPAQFEKVGDFKNGLAAVRENGKWGFIDRTGNWVIKPKFDDVKDFEKTRA